MTAQASTTFHHPVLLKEAISFLSPRPGGRYIDGTLGLGGHTRALLEHSAPNGMVLAFDWDQEAMLLARRNLAAFGDRVLYIGRPFSEMASACAAQKIGQVDGILLDLGVSSLQLDSADRGFSFQKDGPLDMRMDTRLGKTAAEIIMTASAEELADIFFHYGDERRSRRIAKKIVAARKTQSITRTGELAELIRRAMPKSAKQTRRRIHPATRVFQGLRIAVNNECANLIAGLDQAGSLLSPGGRICVISFHSLEDRIVKQTFAGENHWRVLTPRPVTPGETEQKTNRRSRSARLRAAERCSPDLLAKPGDCSL